VDRTDSDPSDADVCPPVARPVTPPTRLGLGRGRHNRGARHALGIFSDEAEGQLINNGWDGRLDDSQTSLVTDQDLENKIVEQDPPAGAEVACDVQVTVILGELEITEPDPST
jgi:hypothetical protein